jgi:hypothetical protein
MTVLMQLLPSLFCLSSSLSIFLFPKNACITSIFLSKAYFVAPHGFIHCLHEITKISTTTNIASPAMDVCRTFCGASGAAVTVSNNKDLSFFDL